MKNWKMLLKVSAVSTTAILVVAFSSCEKKRLGKPVGQNQGQNPANGQTPTGGGPLIISGAQGKDARDSNEVKADIARLEKDSADIAPRLRFTGQILTALDSAVGVPASIGPAFFQISEFFRSTGGGVETILDTAIMYKKTIDTIWNTPGWGGHNLPNEENLQKFYTACTRMIEACDSLIILRNELEETRNKKPNVGIPAYGAIRQEELLRFEKELEYRLKREIELLDNNLFALGRSSMKPGVQDFIKEKLFYHHCHGA